MEQTKRGYNQAFFKKLYVLPEWDDEQGQTVVQIVRAELTEPYAALLADDLAKGVLAEAEAIKNGAKAKDGPARGSLKQAPDWQRIRELHSQRFGAGAPNSLTRRPDPTP